MDRDYSAGLSRMSTAIEKAAQDTSHTTLAQREKAVRKTPLEIKQLDQDIRLNGIPKN